MNLPYVQVYDVLTPGTYRRQALPVSMRFQVIPNYSKICFLAERFHRLVPWAWTPGINVNDFFSEKMRKICYLEVCFVEDLLYLTACSEPCWSSLSHFAFWEQCLEGAFDVLRNHLYSQNPTIYIQYINVCLICQDPCADDTPDKIADNDFEVLVSDVIVGVSLNSDTSMPNYLCFLSKDSHYQEKLLALGVMKEAHWYKCFDCDFCFFQSVPNTSFDQLR